MIFSSSSSFSYAFFFCITLIGRRKCRGRERRGAFYQQLSRARMLASFNFHRKYADQTLRERPSLVETIPPFPFPIFETTRFLDDYGACLTLFRRKNSFLDEFCFETGKFGRRFWTNIWNREKNSVVSGEEEARIKSHDSYISYIGKKERKKEWREEISR